MTFDEAFELMCTAYKQVPTPELHDVYEEALGGEPLELVYLAAQMWIRNEDRMATIHQWLMNVRLLKAADRVLPEHATSIEPAKASVAKLMIQSTRRAIRDVGMPQHWHGDGAENCPVCGRRDYWQERIMEKSAEILDDLTTETPEPDPERLYKCRECWDELWITVAGDADTRNAVKPCPVCLPEQHVRWSEGHFRPNHSCKECELIRRGAR